MPRLLGVDIPNEKRIEVALTYIYGVGPATARKVLAELSIRPDTRAKDLKDDEVAHLASHIEKNYPVEGVLRRQVPRDERADRLPPAEIRTVLIAAPPERGEWIWEISSSGPSG